MAAALSVLCDLYAAAKTPLLCSRLTRTACLPAGLLLQLGACEPVGAAAGAWPQHLRPQAASGNAPR
jgi:hypothetical protein